MSVYTICKYIHIIFTKNYLKYCCQINSNEKNFPLAFPLFIILFSFLHIFKTVHRIYYSVLKKLIQNLKLYYYIRRVIDPPYIHTIIFLT